MSVRLHGKARGPIIRSYPMHPAVMSWPEVRHALMVIRRGELKGQPHLPDENWEPEYDPITRVCNMRLFGSVVLYRQPLPLFGKELDAAITKKHPKESRSLSLPEWRKAIAEQRELRAKVLDDTEPLPVRKSRPLPPAAGRPHKHRGARGRFTVKTQGEGSSKGKGSEAA